MTKPPEPATVEEIVDQLREHEGPSILLLAHFHPSGGWFWAEVLDNCGSREMSKEMLLSALDWYDAQ